MTQPELQNEIVRSKEGDQDAFRTVVLGYQAYAFRLAFRLLCDEEEAKDVVQESFLRIWRSFDRYDPDQKFSTWLYKVVSNLCLDHLRAQGRRKWRTSPADPLEELPDLVLDRRPDERCSNADLARIIRTLADRLSPKQRLVFTLRDLEDMPVNEVVAVTGMTTDVIKAHLWYARHAIRTILENEFKMKGSS